MASPGCIEVTLREDLWANIFARSAKEGIHAFTNLKLVCKTFNRICERDEVQRKMCLGNIPAYQAPWNEKSFKRFYGRLCAVGNTDALFRIGLHYYSIENRKDEGLLMLRQACLGGHDKAVLIYGLIVVCVGENTVEGYILLRRLFQETTLEMLEFISAIREIVLFGPPRISYIAIAEKELRRLLDEFDKPECECNGGDNCCCGEVLSISQSELCVKHALGLCFPFFHGVDY